MKETDLILGQFAQAYLQTLKETELQDFEDILSLPSPVLYNWLLSLPSKDDQPPLKNNLLLLSLKHYVNRSFAKHPK